MTPVENPQSPSTQGLAKGAGSAFRSVGLFALSIVLVPALAAYVLIGAGSSSFFRDRL